MTAATATSPAVRIARFALVTLLGGGVLAPRPASAQAAASPQAVVSQPLPDDALGRAMRDELARSMKELRLGDLDRPYFLAYRVDEVDGVSAGGTRGSLVMSDEVRGRYLTVELRVGDYAFDNTNFVGSSGMMFMSGGSPFVSAGSGELPLDEDYLAMRRELWLATDAAYKQALAAIAGKRAVDVNRVRTDSLPDFWRDSATRTVDEVAATSLSRAEAEGLVRALSGAREVAALERSSVRLRASRTRVRYVNSEGSAFVATRPVAELSVDASARGGDGVPVDGELTLLARSPGELPARDALARQVRALAARVDSLRRAPVVDRYTGPVLFEGRAAAQLFADTFMPTLLGRRGMHSDIPGLAAMMARGTDEDTLAAESGERVMPSGMSVVDDPTLTELGGHRLAGGYRVDDEAVAARGTVLVQDGVLRGKLATRTPVAGASRSTGNRRGDGVSPSNVIVEARDAVDDSELRRRFLAAVQKRGLPWGIVIREVDEAAPAPGADVEQMMMFATMAARGGRRAALVYRVHPDGREELVRAMSINGVTAASFRNVAATSRRPTVLHQPAGLHFSGMPAGLMMSLLRGGGAPVITSFAVPSLLFDDVSLARLPSQPQKPPIVPPPAVAER